MTNKKKLKNVGMSVRARLLDRYKGMNYMYILTRYFNERLLFRVSASRYRDNFLLKGGSLLYALDGLDSRPTVDVDFLADRIDRNRDNLLQAFKEILSTDCLEDGVAFDVENMTAEPIAVEKKYPGTRLTFMAHMDTIRKEMTVDIGFGDIVTPEPVELEFPLLLSGIPSVNVKAYSIETVIAEKFHAMVDRDVANSRMKDFFDIYNLLGNESLDRKTLKEAVFSTFNNRKLLYKENLQLFTPSFREDDVRLKRWTTYLNGINYVANLPFSEVMNSIENNLKEILDEYWLQTPPPCPSSD